MRTVHPEDLQESLKSGVRTWLVGDQCARMKCVCAAPTGNSRWFLGPHRAACAMQEISSSGTERVPDITERKSAGKCVTRLRPSSSRAARRLVELQESERKDLARELHDRVGQNLTALHINLGMLRAALSSRASGDITSRLDDCAALLESTARTSGASSPSCVRPMLDDHGLLAALHWHANEFHATSRDRVSVHGSQGGGRAKLEVEIALFRIAQEAPQQRSQARARDERGDLYRERRIGIPNVGGGRRRWSAAARSQPASSRLWPGDHERARPSRRRPLQCRGAPASGTRITVQVPA